jgi:hypothetical protein
MKREALAIGLFCVLLIIAMVLATADLAHNDRETAIHTPWQPLKITPEPSQTTQVHGWWDELPSPVPFPSSAPRK